MTKEEDYRAQEYGLLDPELLRLIGVTASQWAALEHYINDSIWKLAETPPAIGACLTAQIFNIDGRLRALLALLKLRRASQRTIDAVNKFAERVRGPSELRNRIVHDPWGRRLKSGTTAKIEITANKKLHFKQKDVDLTEVKKNVDTIIDTVGKFMEIRDAITAELATLPGIPRSELYPIKEGPRQKI